MSSYPPPRIRTVGRYELLDRLASGGMATVHLGRVQGLGGFQRPVAIKRLHPQFAAEPEFVSMLLDEARLAASVRHPNVVGMLDVVEHDGEVFLVMEYVAGESLSRLLRLSQQANRPVPPHVAASIVVGVLAGLHAAHEARGPRGEPLGIVHRDISPHNVMVGADGIARVLDFGIAKAAGRLHVTQGGAVKGKAAYMSPEQARGKEVDRRTDVYAAALVLWEALTGRRAFDADNAFSILTRVLEQSLPAPSSIVPGLSPALDAVILRAAAKRADDRFATAGDFAAALESVVPLASTRMVAEWVASLAGPALAERGARVEGILTGSLPSGAIEETRPLPPARKRKAGVVALSFALFALVAFVVVVTFARRRGPNVDGPSFDAGAPIAATSISSRPSDVESTIAPPVVEPTARVPATASASASATVRRAIQAPSAKGSAKPSCQPPFRVGDDGILVAIPECL